MKPSLKRDLLPHGQRHDDPPDSGVSGTKWRLALAVRKYPIQIALFCALIPCCVLGTFLLGAYERIANQQAEIQANRKALTRSSCDANNAQTYGLNRLNETVQDLVASGPKQYEGIRPILESAGIDVDKLKKRATIEAQKNNAKLRAVKIHPQDCEEQVRRIDKLSPPRK